MLNKRSPYPNKQLSKKVDQDHWSYAHIEKWLKNKGFVKLGSGNYSSTYGKKSVPYIVKINKKQDLGALKYYQSSMNGTKSKYFPNIYQVKTYITELGEIASSDIHIDNIMIRPSTGDVVLTDPLAG